MTKGLVGVTLITYRDILLEYLGSILLYSLVMVRSVCTTASYLFISSSEENRKMWK